MNQVATKQFVEEYTKAIQSMPEGSAKDRGLRMAKRQKLMAERNCDWYDVLLPDDLEESAYESPAFYQALSKLSLVDQRGLLRGNQFLNSWDGYPCILVGRWAKKCFIVDVVPNLEAPMAYVMPFKYQRFLSFVTNPENVAKGINAVVAPDGHSFTINSHGCTVFDGKSNPIMEDVMSSAEYHRLFNNKVLISPEERLFNIR